MHNPASVTSNTICFAESEGLYLLKFIGDIRVTFCISFDSFIETIFDHAALKGIVIDLTDAQHIDSTALGMIAKISAKSAKKLGHSPITISTQPDINCILESMGLNKVLTIVNELDLESLKNISVKDIPQKNMPSHESSHESRIETYKKVIDAHRVLMDLNSNNQLIFQDLVSSLESELAKKP